MVKKLMFSYCYCRSNVIAIKFEQSMNCMYAQVNPIQPLIMCVCEQIYNSLSSSEFCLPNFSLKKEVNLLRQFFRSKSRIIECKVHSMVERLVFSLNLNKSVSEMSLRRKKPFLFLFIFESVTNCCQNIACQSENIRQLMAKESRPLTLLSEL